MLTSNETSRLIFFIFFFKHNIAFACLFAFLLYCFAYIFFYFLLICLLDSQQEICLLSIIAFASHHNLRSENKKITENSLKLLIMRILQNQANQHLSRLLIYRLVKTFEGPNVRKTNESWSWFNFNVSLLWFFLILNWQFVS